MVAAVKGSARAPYELTIVFTADGPGDYDIDVDCTCPVGDGCKHGAAVLFAARAALEGSRVPQPMPAAKHDSRQPPPLLAALARSEPLPVPLLNWLVAAQGLPAVPQPEAPKIACVFTAHARNPGKPGRTKSAPVPAPMKAHNLSISLWIETASGAGPRRQNKVSAYDLVTVTQVLAPADQWLARRMRSCDGDLDSNASAVPIWSKSSSRRAGRIGMMSVGRRWHWRRHCSSTAQPARSNRS